MNPETGHTTTGTGTSTMQTATGIKVQIFSRKETAKAKTAIV